MSRIDVLASLVEAGENVKAVAEAQRLVAGGVPVREIMLDGLTAALRSLSHKCTTENFQLLDVLLATRAMVEVVDQVVAAELENGMDRIADMHEARHGAGQTGKTLIIGTIEGDVHDLGKHLVATISRISGFRVVNLGKDVPPHTFIEAAVRERADIVGVSSLMTVCLPSINKLRPLAEKSGISPIIVAGGAAAQQADKGYLNVDYVAFDAFDGLNYFTKLP